MSESFEIVRLAGKAPTQVSQHVKDGITEDFIKRRVLLALEKEKKHLANGSFRLTYLVRKGKSSPLLVEIYVRDRWHNTLIHEYIVYGVHVRKK